MRNIFKNFLYNVDRTVASLFGAAPQETISSEIGIHEKNPIDDVASAVNHGADHILDAIQHDHIENAVIHADQLEAADNGKEQ